MIFDRRSSFRIAVLHARARSCGTREVAADAADDLPAQRDAALLRDEARFGVAGLADELLETVAVELPGRCREGRIGRDALARSRRRTDPSPSCARILVERRFRDHLAEHLPVEAERARLIGRDRAADPAAELLQPLVDSSGGTARSPISVLPILATVERPKPRKMSPMPQIAKLIAISPRSDAHDDVAEPVGRSFVHTSKHGELFDRRLG